ncbi:MAG: hypothetical protein KA257_05615 [Opitutaceae bacterium]|nr:hypothetical protein [Opitutaceae bacterium]MBP9914141.1 hypothetical protein [Opitutaceae bacterium]
MPARDNPPAPRWVSAWPDALAFAAGLGMAWWFNWATRDLVWSLWLSSLAVGYAMIVWMIFGPMVYTATQAWRDRALVRERAKGPVAAVGVLYLTGGLFMLAFFTVHFGMFHFVHSVFLEVFFPVGPGMTKGFPGPALYGQVFVAYWPFVLVAAVAERQAFRWGQGKTVPVAADTSVKAADIAARKARNARAGGMNGMMAPYKNVIRMHLLIFFFAFVSFLKVEGFWIYAVVYAVYFFPWRLVRRQAADSSDMQ